MTGIHPAARQRARRLRAEMSPQERRLWAKLRELNRMLGLHFRRQVPIGPVIVDFADLGRRLAIEIDCGRHGGERDRRQGDGWLTAQGFRVLWFRDSELSGNLDEVMQVVLDALSVGEPVDGVPPSPLPSPRGGGEALEPGAARHGPAGADPARGPPPRLSPRGGEVAPGAGDAREGLARPAAGRAPRHRSAPVRREAGAGPSGSDGAAGPGASPPPRGEGMGEGGGSAAASRGAP